MNIIRQKVRREFWEFIYTDWQEQLLKTIGVVFGGWLTYKFMMYVIIPHIRIILGPY